MKIGFDAKRFFYNKTGLGNYSRNLIFSFFKYFPEHQYFLFTPRKNNPIKVNIPKTENIKIISPKIKLNSLWRTFLIPYTQAFKQLDIYHGLSHELPANIKKDKIKTVLTIHDLIFIKFPELYKTIDRKIYIKKIQYATKIADKIIAISKQTKKDIIKYLDIEEKKISIIYQSCNEIFFHKISDKRKLEIKEKYNLPSKYILFVGTVEKRKNVLNLIKAFYSLQKEDIELVIVGRHKDGLEQINEYISKKKKKPIFITNIAFEDLPAIYQMAQIFVYPSFYEGFGIPIIEAMASGIPVITSQGGVFEETAADAALFINPYDYLSIASAIDKILNDEQLKKNLLEKAEKHIKKFHHKKIAQEYFDIYYNLLKIN